MEDNGEGSRRVKKSSVGVDEEILCKEKRSIKSSLIMLSAVHRNLHQAFCFAESMSAGR